MNANEFEREWNDERCDYDDALVEYLEGDEGRRRVSELDEGWKEVMRACERSGFIIQAFGGTAVISTNRAYLEANGTVELARRLRMNDVEL